MDLEQVLGLSVTETNNKLLRLESSNIKAIGPGDYVTLEVFGTDIPNCSKLASYAPVVGDKVIYLVTQSRGLIVLGSVGTTVAAGVSQAALDDVVTNATTALNAVIATHATDKTALDDTDVALYLTAVAHSNQIAVTPWTDLTLINGWVNYGSGYSTAQYSRRNGIVHIKMLVKSGTSSDVCVLPVGFRPPDLLITSQYCAGGGAGGAFRCDIYANGTVQMLNGYSSTWSSVVQSFST